MLLPTQQVYSNSRHATPGTGVRCRASQGSHRDLFAALFFSCTSFLTSWLGLPFTSSAPASPIFDSFLHSCIHSSVHPCLSLAATVWGGNCIPVFCGRVVSLVPVGVSVPVLTATAGLYIWRGVRAAVLKEPSYTGKTRSGNAGCTGELCCWFRVGRGLCVVL